MENVIKIARSESYVDESTTTGDRDTVDQHLESSAHGVHPHLKSMESAVQPSAGVAVVVSADSKETDEAVKEMSETKPEETDSIMNPE